MLTRFNDDPDLLKKVITGDESCQSLMKFDHTSYFWIRNKINYIIDNGFPTENIIVLDFYRIRYVESLIFADKPATLKVMEAYIQATMGTKRSDLLET